MSAPHERPPEGESSFADVLNNVSLGSTRSRRRRRRHAAEIPAEMLVGPGPGSAAGEPSEHDLVSAPGDPAVAEEAGSPVVDVAATDATGTDVGAPGEAVESTEEPATAVTPPQEQVDPADVPDPNQQSDGPDGDADEPDDFMSHVRPYSWTKGRTRSARELAIETLVSTSEHGLDMTALTSVEHRSVAELCAEPCSVAEIAARLSLPLGVARVLAGDMADLGLVVVHETASTSGERPDLALMERVLSGLRRL